MDEGSDNVLEQSKNAHLQDIYNWQHLGINQRHSDRGNKIFRSIGQIARLIAPETVLFATEISST